MVMINRFDLKGNCAFGEFCLILSLEQIIDFLSSQVFKH